MAPVIHPTDALQQARLAQRLEALLLRRQGAVGRTEPAQAIGPGARDPRLPSRTGLDPLAQAGPAGSARAAHPDPGNGTRPQASPPQPAGATLSPAARVLAAVLHRAGEGDAPPVRATAPLWPSGTVPAAPLVADTLARAVADSGLFYELHLQQFASGARSLAQLQREPQATLPAPGALAPAPSAPVAKSPVPSPAAWPVPQHGRQEGQLEPARDTDEASTPSVRATTPTTEPSAHDALPRDAVLHPATTDLVRQQLQLLESGVFRWSGEPWPGARMEWEVRDEGAQGDAAPGDSPPAAWSTSLRLALPALGTVEARLALDGSGALRVQLLAREEVAATWLQAHRAGLLVRLQPVSAHLACDIGAVP